ncbi:PAS domain-containing sensor histidine kinase [Peredibacter starrii]|uniref:histidine kinase n=1 Tax=Peredibacter starrii TaxID=28202 RepID=A0AAX4HRG8_9BACT|nr:PAS domain-containing protein [Peredibacter starrii]WPU65703.1 PAS domain-containing protein [Peredibacter starrii]
MHTFTPDHLIGLISAGYHGLIAYIDKEFKYHFVNEYYQDWFGQNPSELIGKSAMEVIGKEAFAERLPYLERVLRGEKLKFFSYLPHKTLGRREVEQIYHPDIKEDGSIRGFIVMVRDITDQRRAERVAQESEARFRGLTEVMPQIVWITDDEGKAIFFNNNFSRVTNTRMEDNLGNGWVNSVHPEDRVNLILQWGESIKHGSPFEADYRIRMADGSYRWHVARGIPIKNEKGKVERWAGTTTDIEDQKNARVLADKERERIYSLFMQAPVLIAVMNGPDHIFEMINPAGIKNLGGKQVIGLPLKDALPEFIPQGFVKLMDEIYFSGKGMFFPARELHIQNADGTKIETYQDLFYEPIKDENGLTTGILSMAVDVTEQVKALKNMEEALKSRDQFLSIASHELKTPLTSLKLQSQLTLRMLEKNNEIPTERQKLQALQQSDLVTKLTRLIDDMLDVSRIRTGKLNLEKGQHEIGDIVREVVFRMGLLFEAAGIPLPAVKADSKMSGLWDRFRLEQVIGNLLTNAIRYGKGRPIEILIEKKGTMASVSVTDQGYGIDKVDLERIFGRFERASHSAEVSGLGLGLFISKEIIESHHGKIFVTSRLGHGSTFTFEIPINS